MKPTFAYDKRPDLSWFLRFSWTELWLAESVHEFLGWHPTASLTLCFTGPLSLIVPPSQPSLSRTGPRCLASIIVVRRYNSLFPNRWSCIYLVVCLVTLFLSACWWSRDGWLLTQSVASVPATYFIAASSAPSLSPRQHSPYIVFYEKSAGATKGPRGPLYGRD